MARGDDVVVMGGGDSSDCVVAEEEEEDARSVGLMVSCCVVGSTDMNKTRAAKVVATTLAMAACTPRWGSWTGKHPPHQAHAAKVMLKPADAKQ